jgi:hypothetical protein
MPNIYGPRWRRHAPSCAARQTQLPARQAPATTRRAKAPVLYCCLDLYTPWPGRMPRAARRSGSPVTPVHAPQSPGEPPVSHHPRQRIQRMKAAKPTTNNQQGRPWPHGKGGGGGEPSFRGAAGLRLRAPCASAMGDERVQSALRPTRACPSWLLGLGHACGMRPQRPKWGRPPPFHLLVHRGALCAPIGHWPANWR